MKKHFIGKYRWAKHMVKAIAFALCLISLFVLFDMSVLAAEDVNNPKIIESDGVAGYTVEFTYGELQYVLPGDSRIELTTILDTVGIDVNGEITEVIGSNDNLFKPVNEDGTWYIEAVTAFTSTEWLKVKIGEATYEIVVTDDSGSGTVADPIQGSGTLTDSSYTGKIYSNYQITKPSSGASVYINDEYTASAPYTYNGLLYYSSYEPGRTTINVKYLRFYTVTKKTISYALNGGTGATPNSYVFGINNIDNGKVMKTTSNTLLDSITDYYVASSSGISKSGYVFGGWSDGTNTYSEGQQFIIDKNVGNVTLSAVWIPLCSVTFDSKGGDYTPDAQSVIPNAKATRPSQNPTKADYKFLGWTTDSAATTESELFDFENTPITAAMTLYAVWESHDHVWAYAADRNKLCAYCKVDGYNCSYYGTESDLSKAISVEVNAPAARSGALAYDGNDYVAILTDAGNKWSTTFSSLPSIEYGYQEFAKEAASYSSVTETKDAGYYKASITEGEKTAYVEYQIAKKPVSISVTMADYRVNTSQPPYPSASGGPDGAMYNFTFKKKGADDSTYSEDIPKTPWGDYTVKATYAGDKNHESATATSDFKITPKERDTIKVVMSDYVYGQATAPVPSTDPAELAENPTVTYKYLQAGSDPESAEIWTGNTSALDADKPYDMIAVIGATATYAERQSSSVRFTVTKGEWKVASPTAKTGLTYNCAEQELVNAGSVEDGGTLLYSLDAAGTFGDSIPKATNAGTYNVHYKVAVDTNHNEYQGNNPITVTVSKADWNVTAPTAINPSVTGGALELVNAGVVKDADNSTVTDKLLYSLNGTDYSTTIPTATEVGCYTVYYKVAGDDNHNEYAAKTMTATIEKRSRTDMPTVSMDGYTYGQAETLPQPSIDSVASGLAEAPSVTYYYACEDDFAKAIEWKDITSKSLNAGTYYMFAQIGETETYRKTVTASKPFNVSKATYTGSEEYSKAYVYNAESSNEVIDLTGFIPTDAGDSSKLSFVISSQTVTPDGTESTISDAQVVGNDFTYGVIGMDAYVENASTSFVITVKTQNYGDYIQVIKITRSNCEHDYVDGICSKCDSVSIELSKDFIIKTMDYSYDEASHNPEIVVTYKGEELVKGTNYTYAGNSGTAIGSYDVTITGKGKYIGSKTVTWNITPTDGIWCDDIPNQVYTGKAIKPAINVYSDGTLLKLGTDYTIAYSNNTKAALSTATNAKGKSIAPTVTITGKGNYKNTKIARTFTIEKYSLDGENSGVPANVDATTVSYTKKPIKLSPVVTLNGKKLKMGTDYVVSTTTNESDAVKTLKEVGVYPLYIVGKENYSGSIPYTFTITDSVLASKVSIGKIANLKYTGEELRPDISITYKKENVKDNFIIEYKNNTEIGTATVIITAKDNTNFSGSKSATFKITGDKITSVKIGADGKGKIPAYTYSGNPCKPEPSMYIGTKELVNGEDYILSYKNNVNAGTATVTVTGKGLYTGTKKFTFKINKYDAGVDGDELIKVNNGELISVKYEKGGVTPKPRVTISVNGKEQLLKEKTDYTLGYSNNKSVAGINAENPKTHKSIAPTVTITFKGNLSGKQPVRFEITKKDMSQPEGGCKLTASDVATKAKAFSWKQTKITITDSNGKKLAAKTDYSQNLRYFSDESCDDTDELTEATLPTDKYPNGKGWVYIKATAAETSKNYEGSVIGRYYVSGINISSAKAVITDQVYTGKEICPTEDMVMVTIKVGKETRTLSAGDPTNPGDGDFTIVPGSYTKNINKGTASLTIRGNGEYFGTKAVKFKIVNKPFEWWE